MCGIAGLQVSKTRTVDAQALTRLQKAMLHRGPDAQAKRVVGSTGLAVTRLAIVDLAHGDQPFVSSNGVVLVANGEIYNAPELRRRYSQYRFATLSDCEPVLALYEAHGSDFARHLRGMYAVAIADPNNGQLILSRDPFGIKPLYFVDGQGFFAFASEISALLDAGLVERRICQDARAEFLQTKQVFGTKTIILNVQRLAPGETVIVKDGKIAQRQRTLPWPLPDEADRKSDRTNIARKEHSTLLRRFEEVIFSAVQVHLRSDVPWRLLYSGGLDSTVLMLAAKEVSATPPTALTIGYDVSGSFDESEKALKLAQAMRIECERIEMTKSDFWNLTPQIVAKVDDPMADPAVLPLYMLGRETRVQGACVAICGEGADEIFGGYSRYRRATMPNFLRRKAGRRGIFDGGVAFPERFGGWREAFDALEASQTPLWRSRLRVLQAVDMLERLPNCLLVKLDRALMANSVEGRTPFLDREVVAFSSQLPDSLLANPWRGKLLLRRWVSHMFPKAHPYARKKGFEVPLHHWIDAYRDELSELVGMQPGIEQLFQRNEIAGLFERSAANVQMVWSLLFYALWHSHFILGIEAGADIGTVLRHAAKYR